MERYDVSEGDRLAEMVEAAEDGREVVITACGQDVARLVASSNSRARRPKGPTGLPISARCRSYAPASVCRSRSRLGRRASRDAGRGAVLTAYLDASVLVSLLFGDMGSDAVRGWVRQDSTSRLVSDFGWGEFVATVGRKVRAQELTEDDGARLLIDARAYFGRWRWTVIEAPDVNVATGFMSRFSLGLRLPDAIHLAIAKRHGATIVTRDHVQGDATAALGIGYVDPTRS